MENKKELVSIPYVIFEVFKAKSNRLIKRLLWALVGTNLFWIILFLIG